MASALVVNGGNYLYNLLIGRILGPEAFAEAALLVTLLLVVSFLGMTFQLAAAKFTVLLNGHQWTALCQRLNHYAWGAGAVLGCSTILFSGDLQHWFSTSSSWMFIFFGVGIPLYFLMSVKRGKFQGSNALHKLSLSYQSEMWSRLILTLLFLLWLPLSPGMLVASGILLSFAFGFFPVDQGDFQNKIRVRLSAENLKSLNRFLFLTAGYELSQIIINNFDLILVNHFFDAYQAGLYASMALVGRIVYFVAWMFAMLLLPRVIEQRKRGESTSPVLFRYLLMIGLLSVTIVLLCVLCPELIITLMFGSAYLPIADLLWQYALATSLFAVANIFAYYFLSLDHYLPVVMSAAIGLLQLSLIFFFHSSLVLVVQIQIFNMLILLLLQLVYYYKKRG